MTNQQKFTLALVFVTGVFAGMFLYVTNFAQKYSTDNVAEKSDVSITGEVYGGCRMAGSCLSFRITENGEYQYLLGGEEFEGSLPGSLQRAIFSEFSQYRLTSYASPKAIRNDCISYVDGLDYSYRISYEGETYALDTCKTTFPSDSTLQNAFLDAFDYMTNSSSSYPILIEEGVGEWLIERFQNGG